MDMNLRDPLGALYRLDTDLSCTKMAEGVVVSNGLGWSPDDKVLYYANSRGNTVYAFDFDIETGEIENRRDFILSAVKSSVHETLSHADSRRTVRTRFDDCGAD